MMRYMSWNRKYRQNFSVRKPQNLLGLKLNVSRENLGRVVLLLPSLKAPTISSLYSEEWFAVETIVSAGIVRDLIPVLQDAGAQGIIEYPLNKVI